MKIKGIILIMLLMLPLSCKRKDQKINTDETIRVRVSSVQKQKISIPVHSTGTLVSSEELKLSFKTGGIIAGIHVKEGEKVKKGTLLASLNPAEINAAVTQAENGYEKALRDFKRAENLYRDSVATLEQKQNSATALDVAKSNLDIARFNLDHSRITAPSDGIILRQLARQNELISAGYPVFLFGSSGKSWKVKTGISDRDVVRIRRGDQAVVRFDAYPGINFTAIVDQVGEMSNPYTGTFEAELLLGGTGYKLSSGFIAEADIFPAAEKSFTLVPVGSVVEADGRTGYVYALTDSSVAMKIKVNIEEMTGEEAAISGLPGNINEIVSEGAAYLKNGIKVKVIE